METRRLLFVLFAMGVCHEACAGKWWQNLSPRALKNKVFVQHPRTGRILAEMASTAVLGAGVAAASFVTSGTRYETPYTWASLWLGMMYSVLVVPAQWGMAKAVVRAPVGHVKQASTAVGLQEFSECVRNKVAPLISCLKADCPKVAGSAADFGANIVQHIYGPCNRVRLIKAVAAQTGVPLFELCGPELMGLMDGFDREPESCGIKVEMAVKDVLNNAEQSAIESQVPCAVVHVDLQGLQAMPILMRTPNEGVLVRQSLPSAVERIIQVIADQVQADAHHERVLVVVSSEQQSDFNSYQQNYPKLSVHSIDLGEGLAGFVGVVPEAAQVLVDYLKNEDAYRKVGAQVPRGVLMYGPPGSGKTFLARAIAAETNVPFFFVSSATVVSKWLGESSQNIAKKFQEAQKAAVERHVPYAFLFFDEFDAIAGSREKRGSHSIDEERNAIVDTLLTCIDRNDRVVVIAATNFKDSLDDAVIRSGRFDFKIEMTAPDDVVRRAMLEKALANIVYVGSKKELVDQFVGQTEDLSPADLMTLVNNAALEAGRQRAASVTALHIKGALEQLRKAQKQKAESKAPDYMYT